MGPEAGERFSLAVRDALFEDGMDVSDAHVLGALREAHGVGEPTDADTASITADFEEGGRRGVVGSPHFFTPLGSFFCPSLRISHQGDELELAFDQEGFERFMAAALS